VVSVSFREIPRQVLCKGIIFPVVKVPLDARERSSCIPAPPVIDIQRSHNSNFINRVPNHLLGAHFGPKLIYSSLTSDFPL